MSDRHDFKGARPEWLAKVFLRQIKETSEVQKDDLARAGVGDETRRTSGNYV